MKITFYKSSLCPRCHMVRKTLTELLADRSQVEVDIVDILTSPGRTLRDGVRMIPAIKSGDRILSGIYITKEQLATFLNEAGRDQTS